ncbi:MAG: HAD family phosphatase [Prevotella sp.]|nr:HAD family phosphatase [Prevotella sp.]
MVKTVIFDLGGVILTIDQRQAVARFREVGLSDAAERLDPYTQQGIFGELEAGTISAEGFRVELGRLVGREVSYAECCYCWQGYATELPRRNLELLASLREKGYRVLLLSNTNPFMMDWAESDRFDGEGHPIGYYFDATYMSYKCKMMKPDEDFFRYVLEKENIQPDETLFVDDGERNVATASRLGIHTFRPVNGEDWTKKIYEYLK